MMKLKDAVVIALAKDFVADAVYGYQCHDLSYHMAPDVSDDF